MGRDWSGLSQSIKSNNISKAFEILFQRYPASEGISSDPICFPHHYFNPQDREIIAFLTAMMSFGRIASIQRCLAPMFESMGESPYDFVREARFETDLVFTQYRWIHRETMMAWLFCIQEIINNYRTLSNYFESFTIDQNESFRGWLHRVSQDLRGQVLSQWDIHYGGHGSNQTPAQIQRQIRFLFSDPASGSACKRWMMFFRWMCRTESPDFGMWNFLKSTQLMIPLDTHVVQFARHFGFVQGLTVNWKMTQRITEVFRGLNSEDPLRYDFALIQFGSSGACKHRFDVSLCTSCPCLSFCSEGNSGL
ncbi:MAG: TIGR02757 family protein [Bdellovibrionota bacterium]